MRTIYNIVFPVLFVLAAPFYFVKMWRRGGWRENFGQRFGRFSSRVKHAVTNRHVVWFHAASVGEANLAVPLIRALEARAPNLKIVVSTNTTTGMAELRRRLPGHIEKIYYPFDFAGAVSRALRVIHPQAVVILEAEIWPNFLWKCRSRRIPVFLVNARLSARSHRRYQRLGFLFRKLFASFAGVGVQNQRDAERLIQLGCRPERVHVFGSLKFDASRVEDRRVFDAGALLRQIGVPRGAPVLLGASTHPGEEALLADLYLRLRERFPDLFLVLVPRHVERGRDVGRELERKGVRFMYRREITAHTQLPERSLHCLLVNTTGELKFFFEEATVVVMGKSFTVGGGHNPIEPAALGKPIVFGPHMENFAAIAAAFVQAGGAIQVPDTGGLERAVAELLENPERRAELGRRAIEVVRRNTGAVERTVQMILEHLPTDETYVAPVARGD
ncbi:MAG: 3-deoxy-D-manno-octulosonic acid transferase [Verrucomicrobia bacterium]|nr:MAG: 3-deoxy-D-manno-octulosonic acid transferase [Verrucomicrobiota bacterium]